MRLPELVRLAEWKAVGVGERLCRASLGPEPAGTPHVGVILAAWDPVESARSVELLLKRLRQMSRVKWSMVVVANNDVVLHTLAAGTGDYEVIAGSNREAEFSAYEEGRQKLTVREGGQPDVWLILNDRLPFYGADCLWAMTPPSLRFAALVPIAAGDMDFLPEYFPLWRHRLKCYIRSNFVMVSAQAVEHIGSLCAISAGEYGRHVPVDFPGRDWPLSDWLGPDLGEFLRVFLTEPDGWARAEPMTSASWPRLRMKALSIVNEWLLSLGLIDAGVPLVPWRLARAMSRLDTSTAFSTRLLYQYKTDPGFGGALEWSPRGRLQLAGSVLAGRAGAPRLGEGLLSRAARSSSQVRAPRVGNPKRAL